MVPAKGVSNANFVKPTGGNYLCVRNLPSGLRNIVGSAEPSAPVTLMSFSIPPGPSDCQGVAGAQAAIFFDNAGTPVFDPIAGSGFILIN